MSVTLKYACTTCIGIVAAGCLAFPRSILPSKRSKLCASVRLITKRDFQLWFVKKTATCQSWPLHDIKLWLKCCCAWRNTAAFCGQLLCTSLPLKEGSCENW